MQRKQREEMAMLCSNTGKAVLFVRKLITKMDEISSSSSSSSSDSAINHGVELLGTHDLVYLAERLLDEQDKFIADGKPYYVDIGYHYTTAQNIERIRTDGLLTKQERNAKAIPNQTHNGSFLGDGIYTSDNPFAFSNLGDVGIIVARMQGRVMRVINQGPMDCAAEAMYDTIVGNKAQTLRPTPQDETVLKTCAQALPLIKYSKSLLDGHTYSPSDDYSPLTQYFNELQEIVDEFFNTPIVAAIKAEYQTLTCSENPQRPPIASSPQASSYWSTFPSVKPKPPPPTSEPTPDVYTYRAPLRLSISLTDLKDTVIPCCPKSAATSGGDCPICMEPLVVSVQEL